MAFDIQEALRSARDYWTPERIAASVPLDDLFTVYGDTGGLVETCPTRGIGDERAEKSGDGNAPTSDHVSREDNPAAITSGLVETCPTRGIGDQRAEKSGDGNAPTSDHVSREDNPAAITSGLVETCPTRIVGDGDGNAPTSDHVSREDNPAAITPKAITPVAITPVLLHGSQSQRPATRSQRREVTAEELKLTPYQSIGKVYARKKGCKDPNFNMHVTAFYIGLPTEVNGEEYHQILTVNHAIDYRSFQEADEFIFVPSIYAKTNEWYLVLPRERRYHPSYECENISKDSCKITSRFDLCILYAHPISVVNLQLSLDRFKPLVLVANGDFTVKTEFKAIGYATQSKLSEVQGNYIRSHTLEKYEAQTIQIDNVAKKGMSGGPWIIQGEENKLVYGIQSCNTKQSYEDKGKKIKVEEWNATSPYFRPDLFDALELKYTLA